MLYKILLLIAAFAAPYAGAQSSKARELATSWDGLVTKYVKTNGGVDYQGFNRELPEFQAYLDGYATFDLSSLTESEKLATYINLYNSAMIYHILSYAKASAINVESETFLGLKINQIKVDGGNIWNGNYKVTLAGKPLNLDEIEHGLIRGKMETSLSPYKVKNLDPRIHAAVNCAALSCPRVREKAYNGSNVDSMLTENIKEFLASDTQFHKVSDSKLAANSIVFWYYEDFDEYGKAKGLGGAGSYLAQYMLGDALNWKREHLIKNFNNRSKVGLKLSPSFDFAYNWQINDMRNKK